MIVKEHKSYDRAGAAVRALSWPAIVVGSAVAVTAATLLQAGAPLRPVAAFWFLLVCPGMAFLPLLPIRDRLVRFGLAIAVSIGLDGVVSEAMLYARAWSYQRGLAVLIGICLLGTMLQLRAVMQRTRKDNRPTTVNP